MRLPDSSRCLGLLALVTAGVHAAFGAGFAGTAGGAWEFALLVLGAWSAAYRLACRCTGPAPPSVVIAAAVTWFGAVAASAVVATGSAGVLGSPSLLGFVGALQLACARWLPAPPPWRAMLGDLPFGRGRDWLASALLVAIGGACLLCVWNQIRFTVQDADSMWYHLPMVGEWLRTGSIAPCEAIPAIGRGYPGFRQAILAFLSAPFGNEHVALLAALELPALAVVVYAAARGFQSRRVLALAVAFHVVVAPVVVGATTTQGNDLSLALHVVLALVFLRRASEGGGAGDGLVAGVALGAVASIKYSGVGYVVVLLLLAVAEYGCGAVRSPRGRVWLVVGAMVLAAPWFVRNLVAFGNPLWPAEVRFGEHVLFAGPLPRSYFAPITLGWDLAPLWEHRHHFVESNGWFAVLLVVAPLLVCGAVVRGRWTARAGLCAAAAPVLFFALFLQQPFNLPSFDASYSHRYLLPWATAAAATAAAALSRLGPAWPWAAIVFVLGFLNLAQVTHWWLVVAAAAVLGATAVRRDALVGALARVVDRFGAMHVAAAVLVLPLAGSVFGLQQVRTALQYAPSLGWRDPASERGWGPAVAWVHQNVRGERVGMHGSIFFFPLLGEPFSNAVFLADDPYLDVPRRSATEVAAWAEEQRLDWLVCCVPRRQRTGSREFTFAESIAAALVASWPQRFQVAFEHAGAAVLRVGRAPG